MPPATVPLLASTTCTRAIIVDLTTGDVNCEHVAKERTQEVREGTKAPTLLIRAALATSGPTPDVVPDLH